MLESVPDGHNFKSAPVQPSDPKTYLKAIKKELLLLQNGVTDGILIKGYEDRMVSCTIFTMDRIQKLQFYMSKSLYFFLLSNSHQHSLYVFNL